MKKGQIGLLMDLLNEYVQSDEHCGSTSSVDDEHFHKVLDELDTHVLADKDVVTAVVTMTKEAEQAIRNWFFKMYGNSITELNFLFLR